jgi:capsid protein
MLCRRIGAALGVSWQVVLRDFSESTYSSARTDKLDAYQTWDALQYLFIEQDLVPEWQEVMSDAILRGERELLAAGVALADVQEVEWVPNGRPWIDPLREAESIKLKIEMRLTSRTAECAKMGGDYPTVLEQQLQDELLERERRQALGLPAAAPAQAPGFPRLPAPAPSDASDASDDSDADPDNGNGNGNGHRPRARGLLSLLRRTN